MALVFAARMALLAHQQLQFAIRWQRSERVAARRMLGTLRITLAAVRVASDDFRQRARFPGGAGRARQGDFMQFAAQAARVEQHAAQQTPVFV